MYIRLVQSKKVPGSGTFLSKSAWQILLDRGGACAAEELWQGSGGAAPIVVQGRSPPEIF